MSTWILHGLTSRSLGMLKEAEIIEQQMLSRGGGMGVAQATPQPDYSAQWAEYYR